MDRTNVEDIFRLSEAQETYLLRSVRPDTFDPGLLQVRATIRGHLRPDVFERAWQHTVARHPMLRASVHWKGLGHPVQVIAARATIPVRHLDWRELPPDGRSSQLDRLLAEDRRLGLDLGTPPVMRVTLVQHGDERHELVWTCHHLLLDGWSGALVLGEVLEWYRALVHHRRPTLPDPGSFREYVAWVRAGDHAAAEQFWRSRLAGQPESCLAGGARLDVGDAEREAGAMVANTMRSAPLEGWCRAHRITLSTVLFGAWALLLHTRTGRERPVFGVTLSGRSQRVDRFESVIGMFANTVPLAVAVHREMAPGDWFRHVFREQQELQAFEHHPLGRVLQWAGITPRPPLFDSLVVHANYPRPRAKSDGPSELEVDEFRGAVTSTFPFTLMIKPAGDLGIELRFDRERIERAAAETLLRALQTLVDRVVSDAASTVGDLLGGATPEGGRPAANPGIPRSLERSSPLDADRQPAADPIEAQLMRIFDDLIDIDQIGRDDNFFELGGDSLLVPRLIERVEGDFGVTLPLGVIFDAPTIKGLSSAIQSRVGRPSWRSLVPIREHGGLLPVYLVHGLGGEIGYFYNVVQHLNPEQPVFGLQPPVEAFSALEPMAAHYVAEIRRHQPNGPYLLGGYCLGGCVAFEMARQLIEAGESVPFLAIIDSASPGTRPGTPPLVRRLQRVASSTPGEILQKVRGRLKRATARVAQDRAAAEGERVSRWYRVPRAFHAIATRHAAAVRSYVPRPLQVDAWLFRSEDDRFARDLGWSPLVRGRLVIELVPGTHSEVLKEPNLPQTARKLAAALDSVAPKTVSA